jgi:hypothetical protein
MAIALREIVATKKLQTQQHRAEILRWLEFEHQKLWGQNHDRRKED